MSSNGSSTGGVSRSLTMGFIGSYLLLSALLTPSQAQVILDGTTGGRPGQAVRPGITPDGLPTDHLITRQLGTLKGGNLFHSFREFSIATGKGATFTGPASVRNIISRVTGGKVSSIDGLLKSTIDGADLFFINPSGVIFGRNAQLMVDGALHVSTADRLHFADGGILSARLGDASVFTSAPPVAFGFGPRAAPITIHHLVVPGPEGHDVSVIGGDIAITQSGTDGVTLFTRGQVSVVSVASPGQVGLPPAAQPTAFEVNGFARLGRVTVSDARIAGGTVVMRAEQVMVNHARIEAFVPRESNSPTGGIDMQVRGDVILTEGASVLSGPESGEPGDATDIRITAGTIRLEGGSVVRSISGFGDSGDITVTAESLRLGGDSQVRSIAGEAALGDITVTVQQLTLVEGSLIIATTGTNAPGGTVSITATHVDIRGEASQSRNRSGIFSGTAPDIQGRGGNILMEVGTLTLRDGGVISTTTESEGRGGRVRIQATEAVRIVGHGEVSGRPSALASSTTESGDAGAVSLIAPRVHLANGGTITVESEPRDPGLQAGSAGNITVRAEHLTLTSGGRISSSTQGNGGAGTVTVRGTDTVSITGRGSGLFSNTAGRAMGGDIDLQAHMIELADGAEISAESTGVDDNAGNAGTLTITAGDTVLLRQGSAITTLAEQAGGGNIMLRGSQLIRLTDNSRVTAEARGEASDDRGGNVMVKAPFVILDHSDIQANAFRGNGGNITVNATEAFLADVETCANEACLDASSELANPGRIEVQAPVTDLSSIVVPLPQRFAQAAELLRQYCAERFRGGEVSSFILAGREQVPIEPDGVLPSPPSMDNNMATLPTKAERRALSGIIPTKKSKEQASLSVAFDLDCSKMHAETRRGHTK